MGLPSSGLLTECPGRLTIRGFLFVTNSKLPAGKVVKVYNGRGDVENRIKEGKKTLR
jgi:hypothetical protein